jgi:hypothetical protein
MEGSAEWWRFMAFQWIATKFGGSEVLEMRIEA